MRLILLVLVLIGGWAGYSKYQQRTASAPIPESTFSRPAKTAPPAPFANPSPPSGSAFKCDGRIHCSQMSSCAEATFFLKNCPGTKMDGDNDGIPCESQWCK